MKITRQLLRRRSLWVSLVVTIGGAASYRLVTSPVILVPVGKSIRFDDFTFAIEGSKVRVLDKNEPEKRYLVIDMKVVNEAKRVSYKFRRSIVVMVDEKGVESGISAKGQVILDQERTTADPLASPLVADTSGTTKLAFELPAHVKNPRFKISHGGPILDVVDDLLGGKRRLVPETK